MREFIRSEAKIKEDSEEFERSVREQELDVLRVVYYVYIQYRKYKSALRCLSILLNFDKNDELALLATAFCYFRLKRYRKTANILKSISEKLKSKKGIAMYDYLNALTMTEIGNVVPARQVYKKVAYNKAELFKEKMNENLKFIKNNTE